MALIGGDEFKVPLEQDRKKYAFVAGPSLISQNQRNTAQKCSPSPTRTPHRTARDPCCTLAVDVDEKAEQRQ